MLNFNKNYKFNKSYNNYNKIKPFNKGYNKYSKYNKYNKYNNLFKLKTFSKKKFNNKYFKLFNIRSKNRINFANLRDKYKKFKSYLNFKISFYIKKKKLKKRTLKCMLFSGVSRYGRRWKHQFFYRLRSQINFFKNYNHFMFPKQTGTGKIMRRFFKKKHKKNKIALYGSKFKNFLQVLYRYKKSPDFLDAFSFLKKIFFSNNSKNKINLLNTLKKTFEIKFLKRLKFEIKFSLKNFYYFYILKLFKNFNFKFFFFKILNTIENEQIKFYFLKYEFFGHSYFKYKLLFIFKIRLLAYFLNLLNFKNFPKFKRFYMKLKFLKRFKCNVSFLKNWLLNFYLNKYKSNYQLLLNKVNLSLKILHLKRLFLLNFFFNNINSKLYLLYNEKFKNWLSYLMNFSFSRTKSFKETIRYVTDAEDFYFYLNLTKDLTKHRSKEKVKRFFIDLYNSCMVFFINIKLNNVFVTLSDIKGQVLFKYSAGFYGIKGKKKRDPNSLENITMKLVKRLKKFPKLNLIFKVKRRVRNKFYHKITYMFKKYRIFPSSYLFLIGRSISTRKLKKARRL